MGVLPMEPFVHLHVHTEYSLLDGANRIPSLVQAAVRDGHEALAITDHGNLFGAIDFYKECRQAGIKPLLGCEVYVAQVSRLQRHHKLENPYTHLTLLARDDRGWKNLMELATIAHLEGQHFRPRVDFEVLAQHASGITCLSGCMSGPVNRRLRDGDEEGALEMAGNLQEMYGQDHFFLEIMRNGMQEQDLLTEGMMRLAPRMNAPIIATNDIHYLRHEDCNVQDALLCLHQNKRIDDPNRWRMNTDTLFFRTREEMNLLFGDLPEALSNTLTVAEQTQVEVELGRHRLPVFVPENGQSADDLFSQLCLQGLDELLPGADARARKRLDYEMGVIRDMGFVSYFLIVWDLVRHAQSQGIPVGPGRGSAAGSLAAYVLGITRIDPLKHDLLFERFLNPSRVSMPDIDIDFCKARRDEMIRYVRHRYGDENVCQIITFGRLKAKNALRDMARVLDIPLKDADRAAKKIPDGPGVVLAKSMESVTELQEQALESERNQKWFDLALSVEGFARNAGVHAAGVIIANQPLREIIPLSRQKDAITTQWDMKICEEFGLLKMDFLGLRTLTILHDAVALVAKKEGSGPDLNALDTDDPEVWTLLQSAETEGIFQLESSGMRRLLTQLKPDCFDDLVAVLALYRPGPLRSGLHESFTRRKHGQEKVTYAHPLLEEILKETYGVLIYQEQIMRVAQRLGGFGLDEADIFRKAMGKKIKALMDPFEAPFLNGAKERDVPEAVALEIWAMMVQFAKYGFNKSHSTAYARITYEAAWLKVHYRAEFFASSMTHEAFDSDKLRVLVEDARHHGIQILPPCALASGSSFLVESPQAIRYGLAAIKGVGEGAAEVMTQIRSATDAQPWKSADDFLVDAVAEGLTKTALEGLAKAGGLDCFGESRISLLEHLEDSLRGAQTRAKDRAKGQDLLFATAAPPQETKIQRAESAADQRLALAMEKEALGLYLTHHPLDPWREILPGISPWNSRTVSHLPDRSLVVLPGVASTVDIRPTRKNPANKYARFRIEDLHGSVAALAFPSVLEEYGDYVCEDVVGLFHGTLDASGESPTLLLDKVELLNQPDSIPLHGILELRILPNPTNLGALKDLLESHPGKSRVRFHYPDSKGEEKVMRSDPGSNVKLGAPLLHELRNILGDDAVWVTPERAGLPKAAPPRRRFAQS